MPLTQDKIFAVAACCKEGGYRACPSYVFRAKEHHILGGHVWGHQLDFAAREAAMSVMRGLGTARQSAPLDLLQGLRAAKEGKVVLTGAAPIGWEILMVVAL